MKKKTINHDLANIFKVWIAKRPNGNCQILFALTELDGIIDKIAKVLSSYSKNDMWNKEIRQRIGYAKKNIPTKYYDYLDNIENFIK